jgi:tRNA(fMet)-specific endonuclease VapC
MILDSTFVNDLVHSDPEALDVLDELIDSRTPIAMSPLTVFEVGVGLRGAASAKRDRFNDMVEDIDVLLLDLPAARRAWEIQRTLMNRGERIGAVDVLIAGTAAVHERAVLTRNVGEFRRVDEITVKDY